jgi:hypothetical protein
MAFDPATTLQIQLMFEGLNTNSINVFPAAGSLRELLSTLIDSTSHDTLTVGRPTVKSFATAAVEMWHKAIHSFILSASMTKASPVWSSVSGYYSSHYSIRGFAHLLGYFLLYSKNKSTIQIEISNHQHLCHILPKTRNDGEHRFYWRKVHEHSDFILDPFFTMNIEFDDVSDSGHRNKANYYDHLYGFPTFQILDEKYLKDRLQVISGMEFYDAPIPSKSKYPDLDSIQLVAYYRLVKFRSFLDVILETKNNYWNYHRRPTWCSNLLNFQAAMTDFAKIYSE